MIDIETMAMNEYRIDCLFGKLLEGNMDDKMMAEFVKERNKAFTEAVLNDDFGPVKAYSEKYHIPVPKDENVMKAGIYKAVQYCTDIPDDVKGVAMMKCAGIGFSPWIDFSSEEGKKEGEEK